MPLVFFTCSRVLRRAWRLRLTVKSLPDTLYTGASYGTWICPRNPYVAHGACSWEFRVLATLGELSVLD
eukprot:847434-Pyramimonas_sp.AAC.1